MYITMEADGIRQHEGVPDLETMQRVVDGYICSAARVPSSRPGIDIMFWCNDEGLLMQLPVFFVLYTARPGLPFKSEAVLPIAGQMIVTGSNAEGESVELCDDDLPIILTMSVAVDLNDDDGEYPNDTYVDDIE